MKSFHVFLIIIIIVTILTFTFKGSCHGGPKPMLRSGLNMSKFEGFENQNSELSYSSYSLPTGVPTQNPKSVEDSYFKVQGISGLFGSPDTTEKKDFYYGTEGRLDAPSYGYMNSRGFLVLNDNQKKLLSTRGGNATGVDSQIGAN